MNELQPEHKISAATAAHGIMHHLHCYGPASARGTAKKPSDRTPGILSPAAACAAGLRTRPPPHRGGGRSCTCHTCGERWREPSWTSPWQRPATPSTEMGMSGESVTIDSEPPPSQGGTLRRPENEARLNRRTRPDGPPPLKKEPVGAFRLSRRPRWRRRDLPPRIPPWQVVP